MGEVVSVSCLIVDLIAILITFLVIKDKGTCKYQFNGQGVEFDGRYRYLSDLGWRVSRNKQ